MNSRHTEITQLLSSWQEGDDEALEQVSEIVYGELRRLAHSYMAGERSGHTLQTTALVSEAYLRIIDAEIDYESRNHFMVIAARMMRRILVDHARSKKRKKRGDGLQRVTFMDSMDGNDAPSADILTLDECLNRLAEFDQRKADVIEYQYFAGMSAAQIAETLNISTRTVEREAQLARAWLKTQMA